MKGTDEWITETIVEVDACHWLNLAYENPCCERHGHRWKITVRCRAGSLNANGMVVDFAEVKDIVRALDHKTINEKPPFDVINPTAENLAEYWCKKINSKIKLQQNSPICFEVEVEETPRNRAVYKLLKTITK